MDNHACTFPHGAELGCEAIVQFSALGEMFQNYTIAQHKPLNPSLRPKEGSMPY